MTATHQSLAGSGVAASDGSLFTVVTVHSKTSAPDRARFAPGFGSSILVSFLPVKNQQQDHIRTPMDRPVTLWIRRSTHHSNRDSPPLYAGGEFTALIKLDHPRRCDHVSASVSVQHLPHLARQDLRGERLLQKGHAVIHYPVVENGIRRVPRHIEQLHPRP